MFPELKQVTTFKPLLQFNTLRDIIPVLWVAPSGSLFLVRVRKVAKPWCNPALILELLLRMNY
jgi:hypothetical protein